MSGRRRAMHRLASALLAVGLVLGLLVATGCNRHPDALWHIVSEQCTPNQQAHGNPAPCVQVDLANGYAVLKDRVGALQYLLIPTARLAGMESRGLLAANSPRYLANAWAARHWMSHRYGQPIPDRAIALAINSVHGRTQNQLHIHISCIKPSVRHALDTASASIDDRWAPLSNPLNGHRYSARRIGPHTLQNSHVFRMLADIEEANTPVGDYGLGLATLPNGDFVLLATRYRLFSNHFAGAEEIQDHACPQLQPAPSRVGARDRPGHTALINRPAG